MEGGGIEMLMVADGRERWVKNHQKSAVEITSKPSCSYHFALINLEENKDSVTSVSNTQFTL